MLFKAFDVVVAVTVEFLRKEAVRFRCRRFSLFYYSLQLSTSGEKKGLLKPTVKRRTTSGASPKGLLKSRKRRV